MGRIKSAEAAPFLTAALADSSPYVRSTVAFALGVLGERSATSALVAILGDSSADVRGRAVEAIGLIGEGAATQAIEQAAAGCPTLLAAVDPVADPTTVSADVTFCRLALFALVRLGQYEPIARLTLTAAGQPISRWWPVAYALQRVNDPRAVPALRALAAVSEPDTVGFALRGLAAHKDTASLALARTLMARSDADIKVRIAAVRLLAAAGDDQDARALTAWLAELPPSSPLALEVVAALGALARPVAFDALVDLLGDPSPAVRAAALGAAAKADPDAFLLILSGLGRDRDWTVRAALAGVLANFSADRVSGALLDLAADDDVRVHGPALEALAKARAPDLPARLVAALDAADYIERATATRLIGETTPADGVSRLVAAYTRAQSDTAYDARSAALDALAAYGGDDAIRTLEHALNDPEWPVRVRAATHLRALGRTNAEPRRPARLRVAERDFESEALLHPAYSPHALIDTRYGTIQAQLDVVDAPITTRTFIDLARQGFFNGIRVHRLVPTFVIQTGDPRGDGEGGPGFTLRDELNPTPYLRGTLGMALAGPETGGSQWFITTSPQPHLDAKYTAFGRVIRGWEVLDQVTQWDVIERVRIWDGVELR